MKSILAVFLLVHSHLGGKHYLVEVADSPENGNGEISGDGNDYGGPHGGPGEGNGYGGPHNGNGLGQYERCKGLKELCKGRPTCLEAIKCDEGTDTSNHYAGKIPTHLEGGNEAGVYEGDGQKQHREYLPAQFEHKKPNDSPYK